MSEADLLRAVTDLASILGWSYVHFRPAQTSRGWRTPVTGPLGKGWPDLTLVRPRDGRLIFAELKAEGGKLSAEQHDVMTILRNLEDRRDAPESWRGITVATWRPADLDSGAIAELLR